MAEQDQRLIDEPCGAWEYHLSLARRDREYAKRFASTQAAMNAYLDHNPEAGLTLEPAVIPVVVHVVFNTPDQDLTDADVQTQIDKLNDDYRMANADVVNTPAAFAPLAADAQVEFRLARRDPFCNATTGITRTQTTRARFDIFHTDDVKSAATGGADPWPAAQYLNIWVCPAPPTQGGIGTFPGAPAHLDGVVVSRDVFGPGAFASYALGRVTVHEVGHYLNVFDIYQGGCADQDQVADTPRQEKPNRGAPVFPHVTCGNEPDGDMFMNFMDDSIDRAKFMFTIGQVARMKAALAVPRATLLVSDALQPAPTIADADLWARDTPNDTGDEPGPLNVAMWQSPDIWVRNQNDGVTNQIHQNPIHRPGGQPNFVYVQVRNRTCGTTAEGLVNLYWAKASPALSWPSPWDGGVTAPALMGDSIPPPPNPTPIPTGPVIGGSGSVVVEFEWSPPDPADYSSFGADRTHFCLLARIESVTPPPTTTLPDSPDLAENVRQSNQIVWKNVEVVAGRDPETTGYVMIANPSEVPRPTLLGVTFGGGVRDPRFPVEVELTFDDELAHLLGQSLRETPGIVLDGPRVVIRDFAKKLGPFELPAGSYHTFAIRIIRSGPLARFGVFTVDVEQYTRERESDLLLGGQRVAFKVAPESKPIPESMLARWWRSFEEDDEEHESFRRESFGSPASPGRWGFDLLEDRSARIFEVAANGAHEELDGYWWAGDGERLVLSFADPDREPIAMRVHSATPERLTVTRHGWSGP